jgi:hypothetical protein
MPDGCSPGHCDSIAGCCAEPNLAFDQRSNQETGSCKELLHDGGGRKRQREDRARRRRVGRFGRGATAVRNAPNAVDRTSPSLQMREKMEGA